MNTQNSSAVLKLLKVVFGAGERGEKGCVGREVGMEGCFLQRWELSVDGQGRVGVGEGKQLKGHKGKLGFRVRKRAQYRKLPRKVRPKERE